MVGVREPIAGVVYPKLEDLDYYESLGIFGSRTMGEAFSDIAKKFPNRVAISDIDDSHSFKQLDEMTDRIAAALLASGLKPLDRVTFQIPNCPELVVSFVACVKAGLIPICALAAHRQAEIGYLSKHSAARAHFICNDDPKFDFIAFSHEMRASAPTLELTIVVRGNIPNDDSFMDFESLVANIDLETARASLAKITRDPAQVAVFQLSGGTSGVPKIIPRFHNEYLSQIKASGDWQSLTHETVQFSPAPMMHNAPIVCYWGTVLWRGGEVVCAHDISTFGLSAVIEKRRPNWLAMPLPLIIKMKKEGVLNQQHFSGVKMPVAGNASRLSELTGAQVVPLYGMTEGIICFGRIGDPQFVIDATVGRSVSPNDICRIVDPETGECLPDGELGEFIFKGPSSCRGYYDAEERNLEAFTSEQFCKSGDLMRIHVIDDVRYLSFEGRLKDVVSRGGEKINCQEVERAMALHPAIGAVAAVAMPDPVFGERMCAFIIPERGFDAPSVIQIGQFLEEAGLAKFKWPERIEAVVEFPQTSSGKLSKPMLKEQIVQILRTEVMTS